MKKYLPAGAGEKMQYAVHAFNDNTLRFVLEYPILLKPEYLREAVCAVIRQADVLHAAFVSGRWGARWECRSFTAEDCFCCIRAEDPREEAFSRALEPIAADSPAQLHCTLLQGDRHSLVVLRISHLVVDGTDSKYLLRKLCQAYELLRTDGHGAELQIKNGSRAAEQVYAHLGWKDRLRLLNDPRSGISSRFPLPTEEPGRPTVLYRHLPASVMDAVRRRARKAGATVNDLLLAACYHAYAQLEGVDPHAPMAISAMMDLRRHLPGSDSPGLCNLTGPLLQALPEGIGADLSDTLATIAAQTRRAKEDRLAGLYGMPLIHGATKLLPLPLLLSAASRIYRSLSLGLTNIGAIGGDTLCLEGVSPVKGYFGGPIKRKPGVQISVASFDGECALCIWGYAAAGDIPALQTLLDGTAAHVCAYAG